MKFRAAGARSTSREVSRFIVLEKEPFTLPAFAKINLTLRVLGRRPDNFHEIRTVFQTVTLHDRLTFESRAGDERFELSCDAPGVPVDKSNLVTRAAQALREHYGVREGARVGLSKRIPPQGGLGGGSSDAATALVGLAHLWKVKTNKDELVEIGARLGADVPFFLTGGTALGEGLGTQITPLDDIPIKALLIITPDAKVSTAEAYRALRAPTLTKVESTVKLPVSRADAQKSDSLCDDLRNDFEAAVFRIHPEIERARNALLDAGARKSLLAGSGSSVFGFFDSREDSERASEALAGESLWRLFVCETLPREEYRKALGACAAFL